jgi:hypothetical protein
MAQTAVGLFENPKSVDAVVRDLKAGGFLQSNVRVLSEPADMAGSGLMSTPHTDFEVGLIQELKTIGAAKADAEAYVRGVRRGGVMVFVTGSGNQTNTAAEIMNRHHAVEIEKLNASELHLPGTEGKDTAPDRNNSIQTGRTRSTGDGARLFVW